MTESTPRAPHELYEELAVGHALGALEPEEELALQAHLPQCAACAAVVADTEAVMTELALGLAPVEPPAAVLAGIRAGVAASGRAVATAPAPGAAGPAGPAPLTGPAGPRRPADRRPAAGPARSGRRRRWVPSLVAAALVGLVALGGWNLTLRADNDAQQARLSALESVLHSMRTPDATIVKLHPPTSDTINAVAVVDDGKVSVVVDGLEPNDAHTTRYVLWRKAAYGDAVYVGQFDVTGTGVQVVPAGRLDLQGVVLLAITREALPIPPTGSTPVAQGEVAA